MALTWNYGTRAFLLSSTNCASTLAARLSPRAFDLVDDANGQTVEVAQQLQYQFRVPGVLLPFINLSVAGASGVSSMMTLRLPPGRQRISPLQQADTCAADLLGSTSSRPSCSYDTDLLVTTQSRNHRASATLKSSHNTRSLPSLPSSQSEDSGSDIAAPHNHSIHHSYSAEPLHRAPAPNSDDSDSSGDTSTPTPVPATSLFSPSLHRLPPSQHHPPNTTLATKSAKRRAAEALLAARFGVLPPTPSLPSLPSLLSHHGPTCTCRSLSAPPCASGSHSPRHAVDGSQSPLPPPSTHPDLVARIHPLRTSTAKASVPSSERKKASPPAQQFTLFQQLAQLREKQQQERQDRQQKTLEQPPPVGRSSPNQETEQAPPAKRPRVSLTAVAASSLGPRGAAAGAAVAAANIGGGKTGVLPSGAVGSPGGSPPAPPATTVVPPCDPARGCKERGVASRRAGEGGESGGPLDATWCNFEVRLPSVNWQAVLDEPPGALQRFSLARGYEKLILPQGLVAYVVEHPRHVEDALTRLRSSMQDRLIAIDLEWRPETSPGRLSPVATVQLCSASTALILRTCAMGYSLPTPVREWLMDPGLVLLGHGWEGQDEAKMKSTFGLGRASFRRLLDLQEVAASLGYRSIGLARLSAQILGLPLAKSKSISRSNWAAPTLTNHQLKYASLDVFVAGQLFRALRLWHSSPSPCATCRQPIGELLPPISLVSCREPSCTASPARSLEAHLDHCRSTGHKPRFDTCASCGRTSEC